MEKGLNGKILKGVGGLYTVYTEDGKYVNCGLRGVFRYEKIKPYIGDDARLMFDTDGNAVIDEIIERRNNLIRPPVANIDILFIVVAAADPVPDLSCIDKLITIAEFNKIEPVIIISKSDIAPDYARHLRDLYLKCGFHAYIISSVSKEGIEDLRSFVLSLTLGKTAAFAGASGVGKSSLMNALFPKLGLETGEISRKIQRGKHTTRHVQLYPLSSLDCNCKEGFVADTPGFGLIDFVRFDFYTKEDLPYTFREFDKYIGKCKYKGCTHLKEEGCAIIDAVNKGEIPKERHDSFCIIYGDLKDKHAWNKK